MIIPILIGGTVLAFGYWLGSRKSNKAPISNEVPPAHTTPTIAQSSFLPSPEATSQARSWAATQPPEAVLWVSVTQDAVGPAQTVFAMPFPSATATANGSAMFEALRLAGHRNFTVWVLYCQFDTQQASDLFLRGDLSVFEQGTCGDVWHGTVI